MGGGQNRRILLSVIGSGLVQRVMVERSGGHRDSRDREPERRGEERTSREGREREREMERKDRGYQRGTRQRERQETARDCRRRLKQERTLNS